MVMKRNLGLVAGMLTAFFISTTSVRSQNMSSANELTKALAQHADGRSDATESLQRFVSKSKGNISLPAGEFHISKTIELDLSQLGYRSIRGGSATKIVMTAAGPAFRITGSHFKSADPAGVSQTTWDKERMPLLAGFAIQGEHPLADGIEAVGTMQLTLSHLHLRKLQHAIHLVENNRNVLVESCHIYENSGIGIYYDDVNLHQSNIGGCHISYCDRGGIVSQQGNVRNIHINGCDIESNMAAENPPTANVFIDCRGSNYGTAEVAITGCTIQHNDDGPQSANIRIIGQSKPNSKGDPVREGHITITGNVLSDFQSNIWLTECRGVVIAGNTSWMGFQHNLLVENCSHIVLGANNFDRNPRYSYGNSSSTKNRIVFKQCRDSTVAGLHVSNVSSSEKIGQRGAVVFQDCDRMNVASMTILDCEVGLELINVTRSRFSNLLINSDDPSNQHTAA